MLEDSQADRVIGADRNFVQHESLALGNVRPVPKTAVVWLHGGEEARKHVEGISVLLAFSSLLSCCSARRELIVLRQDEQERRNSSHPFSLGSFILVLRPTSANEGFNFKPRERTTTFSLLRLALLHTMVMMSTSLFYPKQLSSH